MSASSHLLSHSLSLSLSPRPSLSLTHTHPLSITHTYPPPLSLSLSAWQTIFQTFGLYVQTGRVTLKTQHSNRHLLTHALTHSLTLTHSHSLTHHYSQGRHIVLLLNHNTIHYLCTKGTLTHTYTHTHTHSHTLTHSPLCICHTQYDVLLALEAVSQCQLLYS